jgi:hypothetical protein
MCLLRCLFAALFLALVSPATAARLQSGEVHVWEMQEVRLEAARDYANPYADVDVWIELDGPGFRKRVYGFWDGGRTYKVRFVATAPGAWRWRAGSNQKDSGLNGGGSLKAIAWEPEEIAANPNRHGFIRASAGGHALAYADGTPFFMMGDTWLAASSWRLPFSGRTPAPDYVPAEGISFEEAVAWRKRQGFNSISFIAAFPNWAADGHGATYADKNGVFLRNAWEKFGTWAAGATISTADGATTTAKNMEDEDGNVAFPAAAGGEGRADFDRINPAWFRNLDRKLMHLAREGYVPFLEPIRRDAAPAWKAYHDFDRSYARFVQYLIARYGAHNLIISGIHLDWIPEKLSLPAKDFNRALTYRLDRYGAPPFGQPMTTLIDSSTYKAFGHGKDAPWLSMHTVGNNPRNHAIYASMEELYRLSPAMPAANLEPYYAGWNHAINRPGGETPAENSDRDNYFARAMMYGSVLSGGLAGHVYGTAAYDLTSSGEPEGWRPHIWTALNYTSGGQMQYLRDFIMSQGARYQTLVPSSADISTRASTNAADKGLDGWAFLMRTRDRGYALAYFETKSPRPRLAGFNPNARYAWRWYDVRTGEWARSHFVRADRLGTLTTPRFPQGGALAVQDVAAEILMAR